MDYRYIPQSDYDIEFKINGEKVPLYSENKLNELYPEKDYVIKGETWESRKRDRNWDIGRIELSQKWLYVQEAGKHSRLFRKNAAYAEVEGGGFIALLKLRLLPFLLFLGLILLAAGITIFTMNYTKPVDPDREDPNLTIAEELLYAVSGTVSKEGDPVPDASVSLQSGNKEVAAAATDKTGAYGFTEVDDGLYNVVCTVGNSILTKSACVEGESVIVDFDFPASDLKAIVKLVDEESPAVTVAGLTEEALLHAVTGKEVDITLLADHLKEEEVPSEEKTDIGVISGDLVMSYYDFSVLKEIFKNRTLESSEYLRNTKTVLEIAVPFDSSESVGTYVFRYHDEEAERLEQLSEKPADNFRDGTFYTTIDTVYIYTNCFSTYAIGCADAGVVSQGSDMIVFSDGATVNVKEKTVTMYYSHDRSATHNARVELFLVGRDSDLSVARSGIIPPGYELNVMQLTAKASELPADGCYEGFMRIVYLSTDGRTSDTNVELPVTVRIER